MRQSLKTNETEATYAKLLDRAMEKSTGIIRPLKYTIWCGALIRLPAHLPDCRTAKPENMENSSGRGADGTSRDSYGCNEKGFIVACGSGALEVLEVQPESKNVWKPKFSAMAAV